jgi:SAM-dependent methyltransferase
MRMMPKLAPSPLLIEQADALTLALEIRAAADKALRAGAKGAALEANFEDHMRPVLQDAAKRLGVEIDLSSQVAIIGAGSGGGTGKADLVFSNVILELKAPGLFAPAPGCKFAVPSVKPDIIDAPSLPVQLAPGNQQAITELTRYIMGRARDHHGDDWRSHLDDYAGVGLDGFHIFFVRYLPPLDRFDVSEAAPVSEVEFYPVHRLLVLMRSARKRALNAGSLAADFAILEEGRARTVNPLAIDIVKQFYAKVIQALGQSGQAGAPGAAVRARYAEWRKLFREVVSFEEKEARSQFGELQKLYAIPGRAETFDVAAFFFALSTYYGLLVKMLAAEQLVNYCCSTLTTTLEALSGFEPDTLRGHLYDMEREGGSFASFHIRNFLEGELFDWYVEPSVWDEPLGRGVRAIITKLSEYEVATFDLRPEETRDLLKDLYQHLFPQKVRHALGEYYTPDWLAEFTLEEVREFSGYDGDPHIRLLDLACGSGTFLVEAIKLSRQWVAEHKLNPDEARALITRNIVGFDLNPLAVLTARANYIIALGDLIRGREGLMALDSPITIPVYLTDSILIPAAPRQAGLEELGGVYKVDLEALKELRPNAPPPDQLLLIPTPIVDGGKLPELADLIREGLSRGWNSSRFRTEADAQLNLSDLYQQQSGTLTPPTAEIGRGQMLLAKLYDDMRELEKAGLDGLWGRFLLNRFAPLLDVKAHGLFDVIIGNPPWVNWESLPDDYRDKQQPIWKEYGLFRAAGSGVKGTSVRHGAGKKDLSMLMTYVAVDKLLKDGGHLAFVITQTVFKTEAGEGFRKFVIPQTVTFFAPLRVHDLSAFQPFEGATNRTAVFVVRKGQEVEYPVDYRLWRANEPVYPDDALEDVKRKTERYKLAAEPMNKAQNGIKTDRWLTARRKAIRALRKFTGSVRQVYQAYEGSNTGGANGVYWLSIDAPAGKKHVFVTNHLKGAKRKVKQYTGYKIETALLYPLLRGRDIDRWNAAPSLYILMVQDSEKRVGYREDWLQDTAPLTHTWLNQFKKELLERKSSVVPKDPFYSMYGIGEITFMPFKVVWSEIAHTLKAAVISSVEDEHIGEKVVVPDHTAVMIPAKTETEAHYLCALINSTPAQLAATAYIVLHPDPHILTRIAIPKFDPKDETHKALAAASKAAHKAAAKDKTDKVTEIEEEIDGLAAKVWSLSDDEMQDIKDSLREQGGTVSYEDEEDGEE